MIATQDIAAVATGLLLQRNWHGQSVMGLHGPTDLDFAEAASILSQELGRSIVHVPTTSEQFRASLLQTGASASGCCHPQLARLHTMRHKTSHGSVAVANLNRLATATEPRVLLDTQRCHTLFRG
jgi:uncharacterized protein YbjT (DUF2867 family)